MNFKRYALYYTPPQGAFADLGASWLGWDVARGEMAAHPEITGLGDQIATLTDRPRKYGFHATLKAPFRLTQGVSLEALRTEAKPICDRLPAVKLEALKVSRIGKFLALTPAGNVEALNALAASIVREFDRFRAPLTDADLKRRRQANLSARQDALLVQWGYPYVMEEFNFHMTLTGPLPSDRIDPLQKTLDHEFAQVLPIPFVIDTLTLAGESEDGRFYEIERFALGAS